MCVSICHQLTVPGGVLRCGFDNGERDFRTHETVTDVITELVDTVHHGASGKIEEWTSEFFMYQCVPLFPALQHRCKKITHVWVHLSWYAVQC